VDHDGNLWCGGTAAAGGRVCVTRGQCWLWPRGYDVREKANRQKRNLPNKQPHKQRGKLPYITTRVLYFEW